MKISDNKFSFSIWSGSNILKSSSMASGSSHKMPAMSYVKKRKKNKTKTKTNFEENLSYFRIEFIFLNVTKNVETTLG